MLTEPALMTERKSLILDAAAALFRHYGYSKTTVADIARKAKVGVGTVYLEFSSKEEIGAALSQRSHHEVLEEMRRAASGHGDFPRRFRAVMEARRRGLRKFADEGAHGLDLVHCGCPAADLVEKAFREEETRLLTGFLLSANYEQAFDCPEPDLTAKTVLAICDALTPRRGQDGGADDAGERSGQLADVTELLLRGLMRRPKTS